jgi:hypothetical protein
VSDKLICNYFKISKNFKNCFSVFSLSLESLEGNGAYLCRGTYQGTSVLTFVSSSLPMALNGCGDSFEASSSTVEIGSLEFCYFSSLGIYTKSSFGMGRSSY